MGTNYYARKAEPNYMVCPCCGEKIKIPNGATIKEIHIGKSSYGWTFCFQSSEYYRTFPEFVAFVNEHVRTGEFSIFNEYEEPVNVDDFLNMIEELQKSYYENPTRNPDNFLYDDNRGGYRFRDSDFS